MPKNDKNDKEVVTDPCPDCGNQVTHQEGIKVCHSCGWQSVPC